MKLTDQHWLGLAEDHLARSQCDGHRLMPATLQAFQLMQQAAEQDGIDIRIASGYRSFSRQLAIWNGKFSGQRPVLDAESRPLDMAALDEDAKIDAILRWSALPGTSRHHWGSDLDVYSPYLLPAGQPLQLTPDEYAITGYFAPLTHWLDRHMTDFGFFRPFSGRAPGVAHEPWHLSFRPDAEVIGQHVNESALYQCLAKAEIGGQNRLLTRLPDLFRQYLVPYL